MRRALGETLLGEGDGTRAAWAAACGVVCLLLAAGVPGEALAAGDPAPSGEEEKRGEVSVELSVEGLGEDLYASLSATGGWSLPVPSLGCSGDRQTEGGGAGCQPRFRGGLQVPVRLRLADGGAADEGLLRQEDWDEPGDYLRFVRLLEYGRASESFHARAGELGAVTLGHGTIVNGDYNVVSPDHFRFGVRSDLHTEYGGGSLILNDVAAPGLLGGRLYVRPAAFADTESWWTGLAVGVSVLGDATAPFSLERGPGDRPVVGPRQFPEVDQRQGTWLLGIDAELDVVDTDAVRVTPYADFNIHFGLDEGLHSGVLADVRPTDGLRFSTRLEYRLMGENYLPDYFGPLYEVDRFQFLGWGALLPQPKLRVAADSRAGPVMGGYGELTARIFDYVTVSGAYANHEGPSNSMFRLSVESSPIDRFQLGLFYYKHSLEDFGEVFDRDGALMVAESRVQLVGPLFAKLAYQQLWQLSDDGRYDSIDRWSVGVGGSFGFSRTE